MSVSIPRRVVLTYGVFDRFCAQDARALLALRKLGHELIVGCATDRRCAELGVSPSQSFEQRRDMLIACRYVDHVITESSEHQKRTDIVNYNVGLLVMDNGGPDLMENLSDVVRVRRLPVAAQNIILRSADRSTASHAA